MSSSLTLAQQRTLAVLPKVSGSLSFCFSWVIVVAILRDAKGKRNKVYHRLVCGMALADASSSFALALSTWPIPSTSGVLWAVGTTQSCTAQGFFTQFGISSPLYNISLSLYYLLAVRYGWKEERLRRIEPFFHLLPFLWALVTGFAGLPLQIFNSANLWCWIADHPGRNENTNPYRWAFFYGPLWVAIVLVSFNLILLFLYVRDVTLRSEKYVTNVPTPKAVVSEPPQQRRNTLDGNYKVKANLLHLECVLSNDSDDIDEERLSEDDDAVYFDQGFSSSINVFSEIRHQQQSDNDSQSGQDPEHATHSLSESFKRDLDADQNEAVAAKGRTTTLQSSSQRFNSFFSGRIKRDSTAANTTQQFAKRRRKVANQCLRYALAFYWTWIPISLVRIFQTMSRPPVFALFVFAALNTPMQGLPNFIVYLYPLILKAKKQSLTVAAAAAAAAPAANYQNTLQPNFCQNLWGWIRISLSPVLASALPP